MGLFSLYWTKYAISPLSTSDDNVKLKSFLFVHETRINKNRSFFIAANIKNIVEKQ